MADDRSTGHAPDGRSGAEPAASASRSSAVFKGRLPRVLVVDDDALVRSVVLRALQRSGVETTAVASGEDALAVMSQSSQRFDVAFVDSTMPGMNGVDAVRAMRRVDPGLRTVLISGLDLEQAREEQIAAGAHALLTKPFGPRELVDTIARLLAR